MYDSRHNELEKLMNLMPSTAILLRDGIEVVVPIEEVKINDIVIVNKKRYKQ